MLAMNNPEEIDNDKIEIFEFFRIRCRKSSEIKKIKNTIDPLFLSESQNLNFGIPKKRSGHRAVCNNENMWIWGGFCPVEEQERAENEDENEENERTPLFPELWKFNFATKQWSLMSTTGDIPDKLVASHSAILYGHSLIVYGGTGFPFGEHLSNSLYICNLVTLEWKKYKIKGDPPMALYGSSLLMVDNYLYILFGTNAQTYCSNVYRINIKTLESQKLFDSIQLLENANFIQLNQLNQIYPNDFLLGRYRQEVVYFQDKIYTFGGGKIDGDAHTFNILPAFNLKTNEWEFVSTLPDKHTKAYPQKRKFHSCLKVDNFAYVIGGMYCNLDLNVFTAVENCVWRLNLLNLRWEKLPIKMPCLTYFHAACVNDCGQVFIHGGVKTVSERNLSRINHLYSIFLKIPKLSELCWFNLISYFPKLVYLDSKILFKLGINNEFVERIKN